MGEQSLFFADVRERIAPPILVHVLARRLSTEIARGRTLKTERIIRTDRFIADLLITFQ